MSWEHPCVRRGPEIGHSAIGVPSEVFFVRLRAPPARRCLAVRASTGPTPRVSLGAAPFLHSVNAPAARNRNNNKSRAAPSLGSERYPTWIRCSSNTRHLYTCVRWTKTWESSIHPSSTPFRTSVPKQLQRYLPACLSSRARRPPLDLPAGRDSHCCRLAKH